jgi:hypothetical protein
MSDHSEPQSNPEEPISGGRGSKRLRKGDRMVAALAELRTGQKKTGHNSKANNKQTGHSTAGTNASTDDR